MLIYQICPRQIRAGLSADQFPCVCSIVVRLLPAELFGVGVPPSLLPVVPREAKTSINYDANVGRVSVTSDALFGAAEFETTFFGRPMSVSGCEATVVSEFESAEQLSAYLANIDVLLGCALSLCLPVPVSVARISGTAGDQQFSVEHFGEISARFQVTDTAELHDRIATYLGSCEQIPPDSMRLWSAIRYLHQTRRLRSAAHASWDFLGERVLNLYKAIEVLFGRSADDVRSKLTSAGVPVDLIEGIFVALVYVRDQLDSGHPALRFLEPEEFEILHEFAHRAEVSVEWLLGHLAAESAAGRRHFDPDPAPNAPRKSLKTLQSIQKYSKAIPPKHFGTPLVAEITNRRQPTAS